MRTAAFTFALAALAVAVMGSPLILAPRDATPQCNQAGGLMNCEDARTACNTVSQNDVSVGDGQTAKQVAQFATATVFLTRATSSSTQDNLGSLCAEIIDSCCANNATTFSKSTIALADGEQGSVQIVPTSS
jgi:hypothetical protein